MFHAWKMVAGAKLIDTPERCFVDRSDRRDLSIFNIGLRSIEPLLTNSMDIFVALSLSIPPKLSGGYNQ